MSTSEQTTYARFHPGVEVLQPDEAADVEAVRETFSRIRGLTFEKHRHALRDAHAKSHGILRGELRVLDDLPPELRQGLFRAPASYPVVARLSTSPSDVVPDGIAGLRGLALKVVGVEGEKLHGEAVTQDFALANHRTIAAGTVASYRRQAVLLEQATKQPEELQRVSTIAARAGAAVLRRVGVDRPGLAGGLAKPQTHILGETFWSQGVLRYGEYLGKVAVAPVSENVRRLAGAGVDSSNPSVLRDLVRDFFATQEAEYEVRVQLATDLERMPVEDASVAWPEDESPYRPVARLTFPVQDPYSPARRVYGDEVLSFTPWHGLVEHQPLGSIQRVRRPVYEDSSVERHELNVRPRTEPTSLDELPD